MIKKNMKNDSKGTREGADNVLATAVYKMLRSDPSASPPRVRISSTEFGNVTVS